MQEGIIDLVGFALPKKVFAELVAVGPRGSPKTGQWFIADVLTHVGQLALLRRMAGDPVLGEAYRLAEIVPGPVGPEQANPGREFERDKGAIWVQPTGS